LQYDKENWELRGEVKSEKLTKVLGETMSFKEFLKLYPTKFVCMQYLAAIKWNKGFACKNCGYDKFSENNLTHERKCSRCGKIHSVTENSLFHGQKTELNKLFYITYLVHQNHVINAKMLSADLNISINTLYKFIKHVKEVQSKQKGKKWTEWIFGNEL
jgi:transposase-like protein